MSRLDKEPNAPRILALLFALVFSALAVGAFMPLFNAVAGAEELPDGRVDEMVTPAANLNANVYVPSAIRTIPANDGFVTKFPFQVATDGSAVAYIGAATTVGYGKVFKGQGNQYVARRSGDEGWVQSSLQPPGREANTYQGFSEDLSVGVLSSGNFVETKVAPLSGEAPGGGYEVLYACSDEVGSCQVSEAGGPVVGNPYRPLFSVKPPNRTFGTFGTNAVDTAGEGKIRPVFAGGSAGFGEMLFEANDDLLGGEGSLESELDEDVKSEIKEGEDGSYLYASAGGHLSLVDVSPAGKVVRGATFGSIPFPSGEPRYNPPDFSGVISGDGSRVYWSDGAEHIYVRENPSEPQSPIDNGVCTVPADACTVPVSEGAARYWTSAEDGRFALYTENGGLYRFNIESEARELLVADTAKILGVVGSSENGESVYFVAKESLGAGSSGEGLAPIAEQPNLYLSRPGPYGRETVFITTLSPEDEAHVDPFVQVPEGHLTGDWQPGLGQRTARVTGDGGSVVFMSDRSLKAIGFPKGYPNESPNGALDEVFMYEADVNRVYCVSCSSSGEAPEANLDTELGVAAGFLPVSWSDTYLPQWVSEGGGRVFFDSAEPLVPADTNGVIDAYEWEREGVGSCSASVAVNGGCIYLLSGGTSLTASWLIGASASGDDAFMVTRAQLVGADQNENYDVYDARVGGVVPPAPPACSGTGCQGVPAPPPTFATPSSVTFEGVGNFAPAAAAAPAAKPKPKALTRAQKLADALKVCRKQPKVRRAGCEAKARRRYGAVKRGRK